MAEKGVTPLHNAASQGHLNVTEVLVARGKIPPVVGPLINQDKRWKQRGPSQAVYHVDCVNSVPSLSHTT